MPPQPRPPKPPFTIGSPTFSPHAFFDSWDPVKSVPSDTDNNLREATIAAFKLKQTDDYVYHAIASVTLHQVQGAVDAGNKGGLCAWYRDDEGKEIEAPPTADIAAYTAIFAPTTVTTKALTALASNAKKGSLRADIAARLQPRLFVPPPDSGLVLPNKLKSATAFTNPYYDVWAWSSRALHWAGPTDAVEKVRQSHHILPVFYHHFGCIVPTWDAVSLITQLARPKGSPQREVLEIGSGNGYWAFVLRRHGLTVTAVDNGLSAWRTMWISDTVAADGVQLLQKRAGASDAILLLVYPQVSADFTSRVLKAYDGPAIVVAGTQNGNGYTGFADELVDVWMERERPLYRKVAQVPLPSFAAKDEALFVFIRTE